jgi:hypothetical protein
LLELSGKVKGFQKDEVVVGGGVGVGDGGDDESGEALRTCCELHCFLVDGGGDGVAAAAVLHTLLSFFFFLVFNLLIF